MTSLSYCDCSNINQKKLINDQYIIIKQRWLIRDELKKLGFDDNSDIQRLYIDDFKRSRILSKIYKTKTYTFDQFRLKTPKGKKINFKKTFEKIMKIYYNDPWIIKSPHVNRIKKIKIHQHTLNSIVEDELIVDI